ncbi:MAG: TonB-dependent receptor plug domain-containing protein, partial [Acinetobacter sp.]
MLSIAVMVPSLSATLAYADEDVKQEDVKQLATIKVTAEAETSRYSSKKANLSGYGTSDIKKIPASLSVVTSERIADQQAKLLTDVVKNDASVGDGYAPVGYYPNFVARGFALNLASSYLINGNTIRGEQNVALENKEQVEILKGISAIQSGITTPGGLVNYVTKRPKEIRSIYVDGDSHGGNTVAVDVGGFIGKQKQVGYRINLAKEEMHPYVEHSNGKRLFGSLALDWNISDKSQLQFDIESQRQRQRSIAGYQLLDGTTVPTNVSWSKRLADESWAKPVTITSLNTSLKYNYFFNNDWTGSLTASHSQSKIDDYSAFPYGYYTGVGLGNTFGADGSYDIYDYQSPDDRRTTNQYKASLNGHFTTGTIDHHLTLELSQTNKTQKQYDNINEWIGTSNIYTATEYFAGTNK